MYLPGLFFMFTCFYEPSWSICIMEKPLMWFEQLDLDLFQMYCSYIYIFYVNVYKLTKGKHGRRVNTIKIL